MKLFQWERTKIIDHKMNRRIETLFYKLPHDVRRKLFSVTRKRSFDLFQTQRQRNLGGRAPYAPFDEKRCIFVHVPKAAGSSVAQTLFGSSGGSHTPVSLYQLIFSKRDYDRYFKFTYVRNPWDRALSAYRFLKAGGMHQNDEELAREMGIGTFESFEEFVVGWMQNTDLDNYMHFRSQYKFICLPGTMHPAVDFIGYFEHIEEDFKVIQEKMGADEVVVLGHHNKTKTMGVTAAAIDYRDSYTSETIGIIAELYAEDINLFGYTFDGIDYGRISRLVRKNS